MKSKLDVQPLQIEVPCRSDAVANHHFVSISAEHVLIEKDLEIIACRTVQIPLVAIEIGAPPKS